MARVLVSRPLDDAQRTASALGRRGHRAIVAQVMRIEPTTAAIPRAPYAAIIATSARAFECLDDAAASRLRAIPVYCVGARTRAAALGRGFEIAQAAADAQALLAQDALQSETGPVLYLAGRDRKPLIETELLRRGVRLDAVEVYAAVAAADLPDAARVTLACGQIDVALAYSRRSAEILLELARAAGVLLPLIRISFVCMSEDVAAPLRAAGVRAIVATAPHQRAMFEALDQSAPQARPASAGVG